VVTQNNLVFDLYLCGIDLLTKIFGGPVQGLTLSIYTFSFRQSSNTVYSVVYIVDHA